MSYISSVAFSFVKDAISSQSSCYSLNIVVTFRRFAREKFRSFTAASDWVGFGESDG